MTRVFTAIVICAVLVISAPDARATAYTWDGATSSNWIQDNWVQSGYPGQSAAGDTVSIANATTPTHFSWKTA